MRDRGVHRSAAGRRAEQRLQGDRFACQLRQFFRDGLRRAGAAGGEHDQRREFSIEQARNARRRGRPAARTQRRIRIRELAQETVHHGAQCGAAALQRIGAEPDRLAGLPGTQQGRAKFDAIVQIQRKVAADLRLQQVVPAPHARHEFHIANGAACAPADQRRRRARRQFHRQLLQPRHGTV